MENIIQERIEGLLPNLRGFSFNEEMLSRFEVLIPLSWEYSSLNNYILNNYVTDNQISRILIIGHQEGKDSPIDFFFDEIGQMIEQNLREERKRELLQEKMEELQNLFNNSSLEEVESFNLPKPSGKSIPEVPKKLVDFNVTTENVITVQDIPKVIPPVAPKVIPIPEKLKGKIIPAHERDMDEEDNSIPLPEETYIPPFVAEMEKNIKK